MSLVSSLGSSGIFYSIFRRYSCECSSLSIEKDHLKSLIVCVQARIVCRWWLFLPILALNCRFQIKQVSSDCTYSFKDPLVLALHSLHFLSASQIVLAAPLLMRQRHFLRSCAACYQDSVGQREFKGAFVASSLAALKVLSFLRFSIEIFFGSCSSGILETWSVHLSCANFNRVFSLSTIAFFRTSVSGILSRHLILIV